VATYSALVVPVLEAEEVVGRYRRRLDPTTRRGMPAHITVVAPFAPPSEIDEATLTLLTSVLGELSAFSFELRQIGWFGDKVTYLTPEPAEPFVEMTRRVVSAFPSYVPYGGEFAEVVPHLTVGEGAHPIRLRRAARRLHEKLPVRARANEVWLMTLDDERTRWRRSHTFVLGDRRGATDPALGADHQGAPSPDPPQ